MKLPGSQLLDPTANHDVALRVDDRDRVRLLTAVATRGARFTILRTLVITFSQLVLLGIPLSDTLRIDLWRGNHHLLGEPVGAIEAIKGFVIAMAVLWGVTFATNVVVGRFFCGWGCPVGYVSRLGEDAQLRQRKKGWRLLLSHLAGASFVGTFVGALMLWWVDWRVLTEGSTTARAVVIGTWLLLCAGGFLHAFVWRFGFCKTACPIGLYYRFVTSSTPIGIVFSNTPDPCIECGACEKICPVDIDPKRLGETVVLAEGDERYGDAECIRCGDCVEACRMIFKAYPDTVPPLRFGRVRHDADAPAPANHETHPPPMPPG